MASGMRLSEKFCCSCEFWSGQRTLSHCEERIEFEHRSVQGACLKKIWGGQLRTVLSTCRKWKEWALLKGIDRSVSSRGISRNELRDREKD